MILSLLITILAIYVLSYLIPGLRKDTPVWRRLAYVFSNKIINHYCTATPGKVVILIIRSLTTILLTAAISWPLIRIHSNQGNWSIDLIWDGIDTWLISAYLIVYLAIGSYYLYTQRYGGAESREDHKRQEEQHVQIQNLQEENLKKTQSVLDLVSRIPEAPRAVIFDNIKNAKQQIAKLRLSTGYDLLESIHVQLEIYCPEDTQFRAKIEYWKGCCKKYSEPIEAVKLYKEAYKLSSRTTCPLEIKEGYIYALCFEGNFDLAQSFIDSENSALENSYWKYIPKFLKSNEKEKYFINEGLSDKNIIESILAQSIILIQANKQSIDLSAFSISIENKIDLSYETFPVWILRLSYALTQFSKNIFLVFGNESQATEESERLFELTSDFMSHVESFEIKDLLPDLALFNAITGFLHDRETHWIEIIRKQIAVCHNKDFAYEALSFALFNSGKQTEAIKEISDYGSRSKELSWVLVSMLFLICDWNEIERQLNRLISLRQNIVPQSHYYHILTLVRFQHERFSDIARKFKFEDSFSTQIFYDFISFFEGDKSVITGLIENEHDAPHPFKAVYPCVYQVIKDYETAISRAEKLLPPKGVDGAVIFYVELLEEASQPLRLNSFLKKFRKEGNIYAPFLYKELKFAFEAHDHKEACEICNLLYNLFPSDPNVAYNLILSHYYGGIQLNDLDNVFAVAQKIKACTNIDYIKNLFRVMVSWEKKNAAMEYLYDIVVSTSNQELRDFYYEIHLMPELASFFYSEKKEGEIGDYVEYSDGETTYHARIKANSNLAGFIGKTAGAEIVIDHGVKKLSLTLKKVESKYVSLLHEVTNDIVNNESKAIRVINFNDIKDDPLNGLQKAVSAYRGIDNDLYIQKCNQQYESYKKSEFPLFLLKPIPDISTVYEMIFGDFEIYQTPFHIIRSRFREPLPVEGIDYVLDLSSLILIHAIFQKYGITTQHHFKISQRVYDYVQENYENERRNGFHQFYSTLIKANLNHFMTDLSNNQLSLGEVLNDLLSWIRENCDIVVVEEMIEHQDERYSPVMETHIESILLSQKNNSVLITEDYWLSNHPGLPLKINVEYFILSNGLLSEDLMSKYLTSLNHRGQTINWAYVIEQIKLKELCKENGYEKCLRMLQQNPYDISSFLEAIVPFSQGFLTPFREQCIQEIFCIVFDALDYAVAKRLYLALKTFPIPLHIKNLIDMSFQEFENRHLIITL